jgi:hypothetical protein
VRICDRQKRGVMDVTGGRCCWPLSRQKDDDDINLEVRSCPWEWAGRR